MLRADAPAHGYFGAPDPRAQQRAVPLAPSPWCASGFTFVLLLLLLVLGFYGCVAAVVPEPPSLWASLSRPWVVRPQGAGRMHTAHRVSRGSTALRMAKEVRPWREEEFGIRTVTDEAGGVHRILTQGEAPRPRMFAVAPGWAQPGPREADLVCQFQDAVAVPPDQTLFCGGAWSTEGGDLQWQRSDGASGTPTSGTGPSRGPTGAPYVYLEASEPNYPSKTAYLTSKPGQYGGVVFRYHMCGAGMGTLFLETRAPGAEEWDLVWAQDGALQVSPEEPFATAYLRFEGPPVEQVRLVGLTGESYTSDIAVADLWLWTGPVHAMPSGPYLLQAPKDAPRLLCLDVSPAAHGAPLLSRGQCSKAAPSQWFTFDPEGNTLRQGDWCLGVPAATRPPAGGLQILRCPPPEAPDANAAWGCVGVKCCLDGRPTVCLLLRPAGTDRPAADRFSFLLPSTPQRKANADNAVPLWRP